jgi:hypothetical protein
MRYALRAGSNNIIRNERFTRILDMNITSVAALLGTAVVLAGTPAFASDMPSLASPISLDKVSIVQAIDYDQFDPGRVDVAFKNTNSVPATRVVFDLIGYRGALIAQYVDVGSFRQGVTIRHWFANTHFDDDQQLEVDRAFFADGTVWVGPKPGATFDTIFPSE